MIVNVNDTVKVKLTPYGHYAHQKEFESLRSTCPSLSYIHPKVDADGYSRFQIWELMNCFGPYMVVGSKPLFENNNILLE